MATARKTHDARAYDKLTSAAYMGLTVGRSDARGQSSFCCVQSEHKPDSVFLCSKNTETLVLKRLVRNGVVVFSSYNKTAGNLIEFRIIEWMGVL